MPTLGPSFDVGTLTLREATHEEKIKSWRNNSEAWSGILTVDQHIGLQMVNGSQELTRDGGIRYWIFTDGDEIYCSAETLRKPVVRRQAADGKAIREYSYGVAAVFTPVQYRRRGIASAMMRKLARWFDNEGQCHFTTLFSAVGGFYQRFGWTVVPTPEIRISVGDAHAGSPDSLSTSWLDTGRLEDLCRADVETVTQSLSKFKSGGDGGELVAFLPTYATAQWHFGAEEYISQFVEKQPYQRAVVNKGAITQSSQMWCYWVHDFNAHRLTVLRLVSSGASEMSQRTTESTHEVAELLKAARIEAASWGLVEVAIWGADPQILAACREAGLESRVREEIENYVPCLRRKGEDVEVDDQPSTNWYFLEAYQRC